MKKFIAAFALLAVLVGVWWYVSPLWTLHQMREAAKRGDATELSQYVDYPAVREDLKGEFRRTMMSEMTTKQDDGFAMLGSALALAMIDPMIDAMITPDGVQAMFDQAKRKNLPNKGPKLPEASSDPKIDRQGFDQFAVRDKDPSKGAMIFRRSGIGWKLSGFDMPKDSSTGKKEAKI